MTTLYSGSAIVPNELRYKANEPEFFRFWDPLLSRVAAYYLGRRYDAILETFRSLAAMGLDIGSLRIADIGCGDGWTLRFLCELGAKLENLVGIDLGINRLNVAKSKNALIQFMHADATGIPLSSNTFDVVIQSTLFSSIPSYNLRQLASTEIIRLTKPRGFVVWLDLYRIYPHTASLHAIDQREIRDLFPNWIAKFRYTYLRMDWLIWLLYRFPRICSLLDGLPFASQCLSGYLRRP